MLKYTGNADWGQGVVSHRVTALGGRNRSARDIRSYHQTNHHVIPEIPNMTKSSKGLGPNMYYR